jgi:hypothetical protein
MECDWIVRILWMDQSHHLLHFFKSCVVPSAERVDDVQLPLLGRVDVYVYVYHHHTFIYRSRYV